MVMLVPIGKKKDVWNEEEHMTVEELGKICEEIKIDCCGCRHKEECRRLSEELEDISPYGLLTILQMELG